MIRPRTFFAAAAIALWAGGTAHALDGNAEAGKKVFTKCAACHGIGDQKKAIAPNLNNVVGRTAGTLDEYKGKYSKGLVDLGASGWVWDEAKLTQWVTNPKKIVPGTKMAFPGLPNPQEEADVVAYLKTFSK